MALVEVMDSEKVIVPAFEVSTIILFAPVVTTALAKVTEVAKRVICPILISLATTVPDAKKIPEPSAVKSPIAVLEEPTLPPIVMAPVAADRVRLLLATLASTLPVMVMMPLPVVLSDVVVA